MKRSVRSRIRITNTGKLMRRTMGLGHSRTKQSSTKKHRRKREAHIARVDMRAFKKYV